MRRFTVLVRAAVGVAGGVWAAISVPSPPPLPSPLRSDCPGAPRVDCWQLLLLFLPEYRRCPPPGPVTDCCDWRRRERQPGEPRLGWIWQAGRGAGAQAGRQANCRRRRRCGSTDTFLVSNGLPACRSSHHFQHRHQRKYMCEQAKKPEATRVLMPLDDSGVETENMSKHLVVSLI